MQDQNWNYNSYGNQDEPQNQYQPRNSEPYGQGNGGQPYPNQPYQNNQPYQGAGYGQPQRPVQPYGGNGYGQPPYNYNNNYYQYYQKRESTGICVASLVLGLVGIIAWILPLVGYPVLITGLVLWVKGLKRKGGKGMAVAGIVLCCIFLVFTLINSIAGAMMAVNRSIGGNNSAEFTSVQQMVYLLSLYIN